MKSLMLAAALFLCGHFSLSAQDVDPDFARRIRPEYKLNLTPQVTELPTPAKKRSVADIEAELKQLKTQQSNVDAEIARMDAAGTNKEDGMYVKMQLTRKMLKARIAEREKLLAQPALLEKQ